MSSSPKKVSRRAMIGAVSAHMDGVPRTRPGYVDPGRSFTCEFEAERLLHPLAVAGVLVEVAVMYATSLLISV